MTQALGDLQQLAMLAVARLGEAAFGGSIRDELARVAGRELTISSVYVTLVRLEDAGLVASVRESPPTEGRGGKPRRFFRLTRQGEAALRASREAHERMWDGVELQSR